MTKSHDETRSTIDGRERADAFARARTFAAGALAGAVVHESANLVTVFDGMRQLRSVRKPGSPEVDGLLDEPVDRCRRLIEAFRHVFTESWSGVARGTLSADLDAVALLLRTRLRGRTARVEVELSAHGTGADASGVLRILVLCVALACIEEARAAGASLAELRLRGEPGEPGQNGVGAVTVMTRSSAVGPLTPAETPNARGKEEAAALGADAWRVAETLAKACGGSLRRSSEGEVARCAVVVPG